MGTLNPWFEQFLTQSLQEFLKAPKDKQPLESGDHFVYQCELNNLRIRSKSEITKYICLAEPLPVRIGPWAIVSDGRHSIRAAGRSTHLDTIEGPSKEALKEARKSKSLKVANPEFRIDHGFQPPEVDISFDHFEIVEGLDVESFKTQPLFDVSSEAAIRDLLVQCSTVIEGIMSHTPVDDSPVSLKSQISYAAFNPHDTDSDIENEDFTAISQVQFATQLPLSRDVSQDRTPLQDVTYSRAADLPGAKIMPNFHQGETSGPNQADSLWQLLKISQDEAECKAGPESICSKLHLPINKQAEKPSSAVLSSGSCTSPPAVSKSDRMVGPAQDKTFKTLPMASSKASRSISLLSDTERESPRGSQWLESRLKAKANVVPDQLTVNQASEHLPLNERCLAPQMPAKLVGHFQSWRAEARAGRYVPRYASKIAPEQEELLNSQACWQPPLVGHQPRPGAVPLQLLTRLSDAADQEAEAQAHALDTSVHLLNSEQNVRSPELRSEERLEVESSNSSQEVSSSQWPDSSPPAPVQPRLPPDSSPLNPCDQVTSGDLVHNGENLNNCSIEDVSTLEYAPRLPGSSEHPRDAVQERTVAKSPLLCSTAPSRDVTIASPPVSAGLLRQSPLEQTKSSTTKTAEGEVHRQIQVKRTPYPCLDVQHPSAQQPSPAFWHQAPSYGLPMSSFVPGTFDETKSERPPQSNMDAMEDVQSGSSPSSVDRSATTPANTMRSLKRLAHEEMADSRPAKKARDIATSPILQPAEPSAEDLQQYRRRTLQALSKHISPPPRQSSSAVSSSLNQDFASSAVDERIKEAKRASVSERLRRLTPSSTPPTARSTYSDPKTLNAKLSTASFPAASFLELEVPDHVFQKYKSQYPDYRGMKEHFGKACALLKAWQDSDQAQHPFLYDDIVYHHYESYRDWLVDIAENAGNALPFLAYYRQEVLKPSHTTGVLGTAIIDDMVAAPNSSRKSHASVENISTTAVEVQKVDNLENSESSVDILSSISNQPPQKTPVLDHGVASENIVSNHATIDAEDRENSQRSSVQLWLEKAVDAEVPIREKVAGAESPLLGSPDIDQSIVETPQLRLPRSASQQDLPRQKSKKKSKVSSLVFPAQKRQKMKKWWEDDNTPFRMFARSFSNLPSEIKSGTAVPKVDLFSWRQ